LNPNPNKLYVGNLPFSMTRDQLMAEFAKAGTVTDATIIVNKYTGRSKGFGFVEMSTPEEAANAKQMFHGQEVGGRVLIVNEARPETPREEMSGEAGAPMSETPVSDAQPVEEAPQG
jgi:RNA recognition motif-containing protein